METLAPDTLLILACAAFVAGLIDAIAGGGGLITVPALALAGFDPAIAIATNKVNATAGTLSATDAADEVAFRLFAVRAVRVVSAPPWYLDWANVEEAAAKAKA